MTAIDFEVLLLPWTAELVSAGHSTQQMKGLDVDSPRRINRYKNHTAVTEPYWLDYVHVCCR